MTKVNARTIVPLFYSLEVAKSTCSHCKVERTNEQLFACHGMPDTTAVNPIPVTNVTSLWNVPLRHRLISHTTAFCSLCIDGAKRTEVPAPLKPYIQPPERSNFMPGPKPEKAEKQPPTLDSIL